MQALSSKAFNGSVRPFQGAAAGQRVARTVMTVENRVALRFQRYGRKKLPFYRLVAIDSKVRREGLPLEFLGWYDPLKKETNLNAPAIKQWLTNGAQPSETVRSLLTKAFIIEPKPVPKPQQPRPKVKASKAK